LLYFPEAFEACLALVEKTLFSLEKAESDKNRLAKVREEKKKSRETILGADGLEEKKKSRETILLADGLEEKKKSRETILLAMKSFGDLGAFVSIFSKSWQSRNWSRRSR
jgi:hypothetical protein